MMKNIYEFSCADSSGQNIDLSSYKDKVLLIVNTASQCGFTPQYEGLENLQKAYSDDSFSVLAFPCNQFLVKWTLKEMMRIHCLVFLQKRGKVFWELKISNGTLRNF